MQSLIDEPIGNGRVKLEMASHPNITITQLPLVAAQKNTSRQAIFPPAGITFIFGWEWHGALSI